MVQTLKFDVMLGQRWVATMTMPLVPEYICDYVGEMTVVSEETVKRFIESRRPSLRGRDYRVCPIV